VKHKREFDTSYLHNPIVQHKLLPLHHETNKIMSMEAKRQPGAAPTTSSILSSHCADLFRLFCVSTPPHRKIARGLYIASFMSRRFRRAKVCIVGTHKGGDGIHHAGQKSGCVVGALFLLVAFPIDFFFS
jgi:hypothetical protein